VRGMTDVLKPPSERVSYAIVAGEVMLIVMPLLIISRPMQS
jgi:hypothetical protein